MLEDADAYEDHLARKLSRLENAVFVSNVPCPALRSVPQLER